ncbi:MAG: RlmE family RNA methyltransferase [Planctomycetota bacterium]
MPKPRQLHDEYFRKAKRDGYLARSAYKLTEIDDKKNIIPKAGRVLDVGCAPGSWMQVASQRVGPRGTVVGIDLQPVGGGFAPNVRAVVGDVTEADPAELCALAGDAERLFDAVISDMAPKTTGAGDGFVSVRLCETLFDLCPRLLAPRGSLVMKVLEAESLPDLMQRIKHNFEKAGLTKPKASRDVSKETFIWAKGYRVKRPRRTGATP